MAALLKEAEQRIKMKGLRIMEPNYGWPRLVAEALLIVHTNGRINRPRESVVPNDIEDRVADGLEGRGADDGQVVGVGVVEGAIAHGSTCTW